MTGIPEYASSLTWKKIITCTRRIQFCAGHRVLGHEGKCRFPHGHNYIVHLHARAPWELDDIGRVIDFAVLKDKIGGWIDRTWDHGFLVYEKDEALIRRLEGLADVRLVVLPFNPTAENIAVHLLERACPAALHNTGVQVYSVEVEETENCRAAATLVL